MSKCMLLWLQIIGIILSIFMTVTVAITVFFMGITSQFKQVLYFLLVLVVGRVFINVVLIYHKVDATSKMCYIRKLLVIILIAGGVFIIVGLDMDDPPSDTVATLASIYTIIGVIEIIITIFYLGFNMNPVDPELDQHLLTTSSVDKTRNEAKILYETSDKNVTSEKIQSIYGIGEGTDSEASSSDDDIDVGLTYASTSV